MKLASCIKQLTTAGYDDWDRYVNSHPQGSFFHLSGWHRVIKQAFNHTCHYVFAEENGQICGVLPLVEVKSKLFGHALVSTPFCVYGGIIADNIDIQQALEHHACKLAESLNVDYLELRYKSEQPESRLLLKQAHSTFGCELADSPDAILANVKKKQRAVIRHSLKNELSVESNTQQTLFDDFYHLLSLSYKNLGTPIFKREYFQELLTVFEQQSDITIVKDKDGVASSAVLNFYFKDEVLPYYGGGNDAARALKSADLMYYHVMCHAQERGAKWFDFGRSKNDSGPFKYKKNWGMQPQPLFYYYHLVKADSLPNLSPNNPKYKYFIALWQKLPLAVSQFIGPFLSKYLG